MILSHFVRYTTTLRVYLFATNALRLRLSLLVVVPRKICRKAKDFAKGKSVPNDTDFLGGEGWIRLIAQGCTCANSPSVSTEKVVRHAKRVGCFLKKTA